MIRQTWFFNWLTTLFLIELMLTGNVNVPIEEKKNLFAKFHLGQLKSLVCDHSLKKLVWVVNFFYYFFYSAEEIYSQCNCLNVNKVQVVYNLSHFKIGVKDCSKQKCLRTICEHIHAPQ